METVEIIGVILGLYPAEVIMLSIFKRDVISGSLSRISFKALIGL